MKNILLLLSLLFVLQSEALFRGARRPTQSQSPTARVIPRPIRTLKSYSMTGNDFFSYAINGAIRTGNIRFLQGLLEQDKALANLKDTAGMTPLHIAAYAHSDKSKEIVEILLQAGSAVNERDAWERTPLHIATEFTNSGSDYKDSKTVITKLLLAAQACPRALDDRGRSPLFYAINNARNCIFALEIVKALQEAGADNGVAEYGECFVGAHELFDGIKQSTYLNGFEDEVALLDTILDEPLLKACCKNLDCKK